MRQKMSGILQKEEAGKKPTCDLMHPVTSLVFFLKQTPEEDLLPLAAAQ